MTPHPLAALPFWDKLSGPEKAAAEQGLTRHTYQKGVYILGFRDVCLGIVTLHKGAIRVYLTSEEGREVTLFHISAGECCVFSAACAMGDSLPDVQMVAESEVTLSALHARTIAALMQSNVHFRCFVYELATRRYATVVEVLQQILFAPFDARLARLLVRLFEERGQTTLRLTQEAMAREVNSAREVVARTLRRFAEAGWIELRRGAVVLKDPAALQALCGQA